MLFSINGTENKTELGEVKRTNLANIGWNEKDLEDLISNNITNLIPENQLMILAQEHKFQEAADIFAIDESGTLYIFELKRWRSNKENILQVLRYGQIFGQYSYEKLEKMFQLYMKNNDLNLAKVHFEYFSEILNEELPLNQFNKNQKFVVITDGTDLETLNAIKYWKSKGINIDSIPYRVYKVDEKILFEFNPYNPKDDVLLDIDNEYYIVNTNRTFSKTNYLEMLQEEKASAYYERKTSIKNIKKGNTIFLYHTGVGIIAYGKAKSNCQKKDIGEEKEEEYYVDVKFNWKINPDIEGTKAIKSSEINEKLSSGHRFRLTCFSINKETSDVIIGLIKEKNKQ